MTDAAPPAWTFCHCGGVLADHPDAQHWACGGVHDEPCFAVAAPCGAWMPLPGEDCSLLGYPVDAGAFCVRSRHGDEEHVAVVPSLIAREDGRAAVWVTWSTAPPTPSD